VTVDFKAFRSEAEIEQFLQGHLTLGSATPDEVIAFLKELGLQPSALDENGRLPADVAPSPFDSLIACSAPARPTLLILQNVWFMYFLFGQGRLTRIVVQKFRL
jgi:hypothetical protein